MSIDKTDGCQVFLNKNCLGCEIFSAKSSEMNICVPKGDDDYVSESFTLIIPKSIMLTLPWFALCN